jgi:hypothetical protein
LADFVWWGPNPGSKTAIFSLQVHLTEGVESSWGLFYKGIDSIYESSAQKASPPNVYILGVRFLYMDSEGIQTFRS